MQQRKNGDRVPTAARYQEKQCQCFGLKWLTLFLFYLS